MNGIVLIFLSVVFIYSLYMNIKLIKQNSGNKEYVECYKAMSYQEENAKERIEKLIEEAKTEQLKNKARVLLLCAQLDNSSDTSETIASLDIKPIFYDQKGKFLVKEANIHSDIYVWIIEAMIKAKKHRNKKLIEALYAKFDGLHELEDYAEFRSVTAVKNALCDKSDIKWFHDLLDGNYTEYRYEKKLIGIYKRISSALLAYFKEPFDEYFQSDLGKFKTTMIGSTVMKDLGIYDKYKDTSEEDPINSEE